MRVSRRTRTATIAAAMIAAVLCAAPLQASVQSQALYARGLIAYNKGQWEQAYTFFDRAAQADPTDAWSLYYRGLTQGKRGAALAAVADIEKALAIDPNLPHAALDLGVANLEAGRVEAAKPWLETAYQRGSERHVTALFLGIVAYRLGDNAEASKYLTEAQADPEVRSAARYYNALALIRQRRGDAAHSELEKLTQESPEAEMAVAARPYLSQEIQSAPGAARASTTRPWTAFGKLGFEYDSNVVAGPSSNPPQRSNPKPTPLPGSSTDVSGEGDGRVVLSAGGDYRFVDNDVWSLSVGGDIASSIHFSLSEFDLLGFPLWLEIASHWGALRYGLAGEWNYYLLDYESFYQEGLVTPWLSFPEAESLWGQVYYTFRGRDFAEEPFDPGRDGINNAIGLRQQAQLESLGMTLSGGLQYDKEDTISNLAMGAGPEFQYSGYQFDIGARYALNESTRLEASYLVRLEDYDDPNSFAGAPTSSFQFRRHDNAHFFLVGGEYDLSENIALTADFLAVINGSNIPNFDYERFIISPGVRISF